MTKPRSSASLFVGICMLLFPPAISALNATTDADGLAGKVGWFNVDHRGTVTVLYSCLSTIIACTYTSLHLNVPSPRDGNWAKFFRKAKWMLLTIVFPEFTFAKAICELHAAAEDWCNLRSASARGSFNWAFSNSKIAPFVNGFFQFFLRDRPDRPDRKSTILRIIKAMADNGASYQRQMTEVWTARGFPPAPMGERVEGGDPSRRVFGATDPVLDRCPPSCSLHSHQIKSQEWTLSHSYLANMGGLVQLEGSNGLYSYVTGSGLLNCCLPRDVNPISNVHLGEVELSDKAKADAFAKMIAIGQTSWLILSVLTRWGRRLPISQLEVCTVAFAIVNFATYLANWSKPKDVDAPLYIAPNRTLQCNDRSHHGDCFVRRALQPATTKNNEWTHRIRNDEFRTQGSARHFSILNWSLSLSTIVFGIIHCMAWFTDFPTEVEKVMWLAASIVSVALPLLNLALTGFVHGILAYKGLKRASKIMFRDPLPQQPCFNKDWIPLGYGIAIATRVNQEQSIPVLRQHQFWTLLKRFSETVVQPLRNGSMDPVLPELWQELKTSYATLQEIGIYLDYVPTLSVDNAPEGFPVFRAARGRDTKVFRLVLGALNNPHEAWTEELSKLERSRRTTDRLSFAFGWAAWCIYIVARMMTLALAFAALRSQDEGVYRNTWTKNLPSVG